MRVVAANKFYFAKGGAEVYLFTLKRILEEHGHEVVPFAMLDERNEPSEYSRYFVSHEDFEAGGPLSSARAAARVIYSLEARRKVEALVDAVGPDIAHLHNIAHQLSPSIIDGLRSRGVPVVQTLHDYKLICPSYLMLSDGRPCDRCAGGRYYNAVRRRCLKDSLAKSVTVCLEAFLHTALRTYERGVRLFIAPSESMRDRIVDHGVPSERVVHVPNTVSLDRYTPRYESLGYAVYVGRLSEGKGLRTLLAAAAIARDVRVRIVGTGPLESGLREEAARGGLDNVEFMGYRTGDELQALFDGALFVVIPSEWYENAPLVVYESMALGKAVLGSSIGGIPELVSAGETGLLFKPGDVEALAGRMSELAADPGRTIEMGRAGRRRLEREYAPEKHYERLMRVYERAAA